MNLIRAFIAIELPAQIRQQIGHHTNLLQKKIGACVRWVPARNIHLTLKFLGEVTPKAIEQMQQAIQLEAERTSAFDISIGQIGTFPNVRQPRVIWVGVQAPPALEQLQHSIEACTSHLGYPAEGKKFSPHLTIGRVREHISQAELQNLRTELECAQVGEMGTIKISEIHLFKSDLQTGGAVYTRLFTAPFLN